MILKKPESGGKLADTINLGDRVEWTGNPNPWCCPGTVGTVDAIARNDSDQLRVTWDERRSGLEYTWERRRNLSRQATP